MKKWSRSRKTTSQFILDAKEIHGDKYGYQKVEYHNNYTNIVIQCFKHGDFKQTPNNHLRGKGCGFCTGRISVKPDLSGIINKDGSRLIPLTKGKHCVVDSDMYDELINFHWRITSSGYAVATINGESKAMHRFIMGLSSPSIFCDHRDRDKLNNRKNNLRICNKSQNAMNVSPIVGTSIYKGVYLHKASQKWHAKIRHKSKSISLGYFFDEISAAKAYDSKAKEIFKEFACINFPDIDKDSILNTEIILP